MNLMTTALSGVLAALVTTAVFAEFGFVSNLAPGASTWVILAALTVGYRAVPVRWTRR